MSYSYNHSRTSKGASGISSRLSGVYEESSIHGGFGGSGISQSISRMVSSGSLPSAFGGGVSFSGAGGSGFSGGSASHGGDGLLSGNEKYTMQNLNDRLSNYLVKVRSLEDANNDLEHKIHEWYEKQGSITVREQNYSPYYTTIEELREKILNATMENNDVLLAIDNACLAADDFKLKHENEQSMRMRVESDTHGLRKVLDELTLTRSDFELQIENLKEELAYLKKGGEMSEKGQLMRGTVNVEMDAAPGTDLTKTLTEMRDQYEYIAEKNKRDVEAEYLSQSESVQKQVVSNTEQMIFSKNETTDLRHYSQGLEIELQSQLCMSSGLKSILEETKARYASKLHQLQNVIDGMESQLADLRSDLEQQNMEYKTLLDIKAHLEAEIGTYRKLLEEHNQSINDNHNNHYEDPQDCEKEETSAAEK
ncbi:hypothetical protein GDO81_013239 [Engystomops pustulosus]|uniref:IF rod domain-containing protein n=1 Tax=Engystomops pustulosus TaxID=76066 RepID=A0AAV7B4K6_ENGPU|nr:hypothetical protein GDO81_013239 [Engystomops pustulosus]